MYVYVPYVVRYLQNIQPYSFNADVVLDYDVV
jgi:hypothetical protein